MVTVRERETKKVTDAQAWRAVAEFRRMLTTFSGYATSLMGRPISVVPARDGGGTYTDGRTIYVRTPFGLGLTTPHDKADCGLRDEDWVQTCKACRIREDIIHQQYHELAHIMYDSDFTPAPDRIATHPFLPMLDFALEDVRVNLATVDARPGIGDYNEAAYNMILRDGTTRPDGKQIFWHTADKPMQLTIAMLGAGQGFADPKPGWLANEVIELMQVEEMQMFAWRSQQTRSTDEMRDLASDVLEYLLEIGFIAPKNETQPEEQDDTDNDADDDAQDAGGDISIAIIGGSGESSGNFDGSPAGMDPDEEESNAVQSGGKSEPVDEAGDGIDGVRDESQERRKVNVYYFTEDDLEKGIKELADAIHAGDEHLTSEQEQSISVAVQQAESFDSPSAIVSGVETQVCPSGPRTLETSSAAVTDGLMRARLMLTDNARAKNQGNLRSGRINTRVLGRRVPIGDDRLFKKKRLPGKKSYEFLLMLDVSGSTYGETIELIRECAHTQAEVLNRLGMPFSIYTHTGVSSGGYQGNYKLRIDQVKAVGETWAKETQSRLARITPREANLDGHTLEWARKHMHASTATDKIVLYYSDGGMPAENSQEELMLIKREILSFEREGIVLLGVGINTDDPGKHGMKMVKVTCAADVTHVIDQVREALT